MSKLQKYFQTGGTAIVAEDKEWIKNNEGDIFKITDAPKHESTKLIDGDKVKKVKPGKGGVVIPNAESVISATHENRNSKDKLYTHKDAAIKLMPTEVKGIGAALNLPLKLQKKGISPGKLLDLLIEKRTKVIETYKDPLYDKNSLKRVNAINANKAVLQAMPTEDELYDVVFDLQEQKKIGEGEETFQTGGYTVRKGDTLSKLANRYGTTVQDIAKLNGITDINKIKEGITLDLPGIKSKPSQIDNNYFSNNDEDGKYIKSSSRNKEQPYKFASQDTNNYSTSYGLPNTDYSEYLNPTKSDRPQTTNPKVLDTQARYDSLYNLTPEDVRGLDKFSKNVLKKELVKKGYISANAKDNELYKGFDTYKERNTRVRNFKEPDAPLQNAFRTISPLPNNINQLILKEVAGSSKLNSKSLGEEDNRTLKNVIVNAIDRNKSTKGGTEYIDYGVEYDKTFNRGDNDASKLLNGSLFDSKYRVASTVGRGSYYQDPETKDILYSDNYNWNKEEKNFDLSKEKNLGKRFYKGLRNLLRDREGAEDLDANTMNIKFTSKAGNLGIPELQQSKLKKYLR